MQHLANTENNMPNNYLILSDIHGDVEGVMKAFERLETDRFDQILILGDILYHGPRNDLPKHYTPKEVIALLNRYANKIIAVRGNCEAEVDQMVLNFPCMATYNILPYHTNKIFMTHGHKYSKENLPPLMQNDIFLSGHTHIYTAAYDTYYFLNPGSVSLAKNNNPNTYATIIDDVYTIWTLDHTPLITISLSSH